MNLIKDVRTREDLDRYLEQKLIDHDITPTPERKLAFLQGAKSELDRPGPDRFSEIFHEIRNLVNAEILRLRAEKHTDPRLF